MFFIGILGVGQKRKPLGEIGPVVCPGCGKSTRLRVEVEYRYFHLFFIPLFRWNERTLATSPCCPDPVVLDEETGRAVRRGEPVDLENLAAGGPWNADQETEEGCVCQRQPLPDEYRFCPYCGRDLNR